MQLLPSITYRAVLPLLLLCSACTVQETGQDLGQSTGALNSFAPSAETDGNQDDSISFGFANLPNSREPTEPENPCPDGFEFSVNADLVAFCVHYDIAMPDTDSLRAYTDDLHAGYLGFSWDMNDAPKYGCPSGMRAIRTTDATGHCLFSGIWVPDSDTLESYVDELEAGNLGFSWYLDDTEDTPTPFYQRAD